MMTEDYVVDYSWCEPLNLVKKKPSKPVAVVAPSSVVDNNNISTDKVKSLYDYSDNRGGMSNRTVNDYFSKNNCVKNNRKINNYNYSSNLITEQYADLMREKEFLCNKSNSVGGKSDNVPNLPVPSSAPTPPEGINSGFYSVFNNLPSCEQSFLTALYMRNLMNMSLMAPPPNGSTVGMMSSPASAVNGGGGGGLANQFVNGSYPTSNFGNQYHSSFGSQYHSNFNNQYHSNFGNQYHPFIPSSLDEEDEEDIPVAPQIARKKFWEIFAMSGNKSILQLHEEARLEMLEARQYVMNQTRNSSVSVSSTDDMPAKQQQGYTILKIPNSKDDFSNSFRDVVSKSVCEKKVKNRSSSLDHKNSSSGVNDGSKTQDSGHTSNNQDKKKPHIKKPLNAFMLYMKEMRAKVVAECTLKESAAINQILGRRWHSLTREEQAKYYEKARQERQLHMELYPGWSARDNYGYGAKKKKRKKERVPISDSGGNSMKKCRARYGLDQQSQWCKPCRRKKKCIRYMECGDDGNQSEDNLGSCGSVGDAQTPPEDDGESFHQSMSSPGGLSGLSSLTSPSMILPSPSASLASPSVSLASPCMSLQSPLTPHALDFDCVGQNKSIVPPPPPPCLPLLINHQLAVVQPHRNPVGTNPHDINNPLSVNQLTGKCIKNSSSPSAGSSSATSSSKDSSSSSRPVISVT